MALTRSVAKRQAAVVEDDDEVQPPQRGGKKGRRFRGNPRQNVEDVEMVRGETRSKSTFRRIARGNYTSLASLKRAHQRIFSLEPVLAVCGE